MNDLNQPLSLLRCFSVPMTVEVDCIVNGIKNIITINITDDIFKNNSIDISKSSVIDLIQVCLNNIYKKGEYIVIQSVDIIDYKGDVEVFDI